MLDPFSPFEADGDPVSDLQASILTMPRRTFWAFLGAAVFAQVGVLALSLGMLLMVFRGQRVAAGLLISGGILAVGITVVLYWWQRAQPEPTD